MKKILQTTLFLTLTVIFCQDALSTVPPQLTEQDICEAGGGSWEGEFNSCGDSCILLTDPDVNCAELAGPACNCGDDACWDEDEKECISNNEFTGDLNLENSTAGCTLHHLSSPSPFKKFHPLLGIFFLGLTFFFLRQKWAVNDYNH